MTRVAGHPEYVGVTVIDRFDRRNTATSRTMPSSTIETTGISGSSDRAERAPDGCACDPTRRAARFVAGARSAFDDRFHHHRASGCERGSTCISASRRDRCSVCTPCLPPPLAPCMNARPGTASVASPSTVLRRATATAARAPHVRGDACVDQRALGRIGGEHLARVHPQRVDCRLHPRVRYVGAVAKADAPSRAERSTW